MMIVKVTCFKLGDKLNEGKVCVRGSEEKELILFFLFFLTFTFRYGLLLIFNCKLVSSCRLRKTIYLECSIILEKLTLRARRLFRSK